MPFPQLHTFPTVRPGAYELQMGLSIVRLVNLFASVVVDRESNRATCRLAADPERWSAGHAFFDEIRNRLFVAIKKRDNAREAQYYFEEACCQTIYNATNPVDPFDPSSPYFVAPFAFALAQSLGIPVAQVVATLTSNA